MMILLLCGYLLASLIDTNSIYTTANGVRFVHSSSDQGLTSHITYRLLNGYLIVGQLCDATGDG